MFCMRVKVFNIHHLDDGREDREQGQTGESTAQANAEGPGPNNLALSELQAVWTGKQKLCQDLQKAEDFSSELASRNAH